MIRTLRKAASARPPAQVKIRWSEAEYFLFDVAGWSADYSFGVEDPKLFGRHVNDSQHIGITGSVRRPSRFAGRKVDMTLLPSDSSAEKTWGYEHELIGTLSISKAVLNCSVWMPPERMTYIATLFAAERFKYVMLQCIPGFSNRDWNVMHISLRMVHRGDDLPPEEPRPRRRPKATRR